jgi:2-oxoglutarate ferredoxin oxidoreductase subunit alpha
VILLPATVKECFDFGVSGFDLADTLQTPVFVLSDVDLGMNHWMSEPFEYPKEPINRGKVMTAEDVEKNGFARYKDIDGDGIGYRTLPGNTHPLAAWLARGTGHNEAPDYSEKSQDLINTMARLDRKFDTARQLLPGPVIDEMEGARTGIIAYGSTVFAIDEACTHLAAEGFPTGFLRLRALPISDAVGDFVSRYDQVYVIELNYEGQLHKILQTEMPDMATRLISLAHFDGLPLTAGWVIDRLKCDTVKADRQIN